MIQLHRPCGRSDYTKVLCFLYCAILIWSAISPKDYAIWFLEIFGVVLVVSIYFYFDRLIQFTVVTNVWFFIAISLITVGAHYSFPDVPFFEHNLDWLAVPRNNYDKLGHVVQGVLPVLIAREVLIKKGISRDIYWNSFLAFCVAMSTTAVYELIEWLFIILLGNNEYTYDVLGTQGYVWDAQSDMLMALIGALLAMFLGKKHFSNLLRTP